MSTDGLPLYITPVPTLHEIQEGVIRTEVERAFDLGFQALGVYSWKQRGMDCGVVFMGIYPDSTRELKYLAGSDRHYEISQEYHGEATRPFIETMGMHGNIAAVQYWDFQLEYFKIFDMVPVLRRVALAPIAPCEFLGVCHSVRVHRLHLFTNFEDLTQGSTTGFSPASSFSGES